MTQPLVVDASVVIKWVVQEEQTAEALRLRDNFTLIAPELIFAECANILWKKRRRGDLTAEEVSLAAMLIDRLDIEIVSMRALVEPAAALSVQLDHPAYDCIYLALAVIRDGRFVTADAGFERKVRQVPPKLLPAELRERCILLGAVRPDADI